MFTKKTVLLIGLLLATLALVTGTAPSRVASGSEIWIYPTGEALTDTCTLLNAVRSANPGDTIRMGQGTWVIGKENTSGELGYAVWSGGPDPIDSRSAFRGDILNNREHILIDKDLTIKGEKSADGVPTTILTDAGWVLDWTRDENWTQICNHKGAKVRFEDLKFEEWGYPFMMMAPFELVNIHADTVFSFAWPIVDVRTIYPKYASTGSFANPRTSLIKDCVIDNFGSVHHLHGVCEAVLEGNIWKRTGHDIVNTGGWGRDWPVRIDGYGIRLLRLDQNPTTLDDLDTTICRNVTVRNNVWSNWDENEGYGAKSHGGLIIGSRYGKTERIFVRRNTFEKLHDAYSAILSLDAERVEVINNTIRDFLGHSFRSVVMFLRCQDSEATSNTFDAISNTYGGIEVVAGSRNSLFSNNFRQSGFTGWNVESGCVLLWLGGEHLVVEHLFPEGTNMCDQILDLGNDNRIPGYNGVCFVAEGIRAICEAKRAEREQMMLELEGRKR